MSSPHIDKLLQEMIRERDEFAQLSNAKIQAMDEAINARRRATEGFPLFVSSGSEPVAAKDEVGSVAVSSDFVGLPYPAAVHKALSLQPRGQAMTVDQILDVMRCHGVVPESQSPRGTVQTALNRRKKEQEDVVHTGLGEWGLKEWYSESDLKKFALAQNGANARDAALHSEAMKKGIAATQARGAFYGQPPKISAEMWEVARRMLVDEGKSASETYDVVVKMTPDGIKPIGKGAFMNRKTQIVNGEPYPDKWKAYFDRKKKELEAKNEILARHANPKIVSIK